MLGLCMLLNYVKSKFLMPHSWLRLKSLTRISPINYQFCMYNNEIKKTIKYLIIIVYKLMFTFTCFNVTNLKYNITDIVFEIIFTTTFHKPNTDQCQQPG